MQTADWEALWGPTSEGEEGRRTGQDGVLESYAVTTQASADPGGGSGAAKSFSLVPYRCGHCLQPWNEKMLAP